MKISTKGRYGLMAMIDLAIHYSEGQVTLSSIAQRQEISESYLEQLLNTLKKAGLANSTRGHQGGYVLAKDPAEITLFSIVEVLEGTLSPIHCIDKGQILECNRKDVCASKCVWEKVRNSICNALETITLKELADQQKKLYEEAANKLGIEDVAVSGSCGMIILKSSNSNINNIAFNGRWLIEKERDRSRHNGNELQYSVALTEKEQLFALWEDIKNPQKSGYKIYSTLSELKSGNELPAHIIHLATTALNVEEDIKFLDI
jgi:Rrf2 family transcriptional regulator, cysteine metabolism repressor